MQTLLDKWLLTAPKDLKAIERKIMGLVGIGARLAEIGQFDKALPKYETAAQYAVKHMADKPSLQLLAYMPRCQWLCQLGRIKEAEADLTRMEPILAAFP